MFNVVKLTREHLEIMALEPVNDYVSKWLVEGGSAKHWVNSNNAFSGFVNNELMICVGLAEYWQGRAHIWALFSKKAERNFVSVFRGMQKFLESRPYRRIEMDVPLYDEFTEMAHRRAALLGFTLECPRAVHYRPCGGDSALYAWIKGAQ